jgi:hypothetical protein
MDIDATSLEVQLHRVTLADLLVSCAVLGLTLGATLTTLDQGQRVWAVSAARVEAQQSGRAALVWLAAELRTAGQGTEPRRASVLTVIEPTRVGVRIHPGRAGATQQVTWWLAGGVLRRDAGGGAQPVVDGAQSLRLTYFDATGAPTDEAAAVRRVAITLVTRAEHAVPPYGRGHAAVFTTDVHLRNR